MSRAHVANNSGAVEWYTPAAVVKAARAVLGTIDLDPASCEEANRVVQATRFYSVEEDGLAQRWAGRVFLNPPYAGGVIGKFTDKLLEHYRAADVSEAVALVNNATDTEWCQSILKAASAVCFIKGRLRFWRHDRGDEGTPLQGQMVVYLGSTPELFTSVFARFGPVLVTFRHETKGELFGKPAGRPVRFGRPMTAAERQRRHRSVMCAEGTR